MFCTHCERDLPTFRFCPVCGNPPGPQVNVNQPDETQAYGSPQNSPQGTPKDLKNPNTQPNGSQSMIDTDVISCNPNSVGNREIQYSIISHYPTVKDVGIAFKGVNSNGKVVSVSVTTVYNLAPEHIKYDTTYIDDNPGFTSCEIWINEVTDS